MLSCSAAERVAQRRREAESVGAERSRVRSRRSRGQGTIEATTQRREESYGIDEISRHQSPQCLDDIFFNPISGARATK